MTHIDDWLDMRHETPPTDAGELFARNWLEHFRWPAYQKNYQWLKTNPLFCTYAANRYRCTGCSRMGDVWLTADFTREHGYDHRVNVDTILDWSDTP